MIVLLQFIKYSFWGVVSTGLNLVLFYWMTHIGINYMIANALSFFLAVIISYFLNEAFVFQQKKAKERTQKILKYILVRVISLCVDSKILFLCVTIWDKDMMLSKMFSSIVVILSTYFFNKTFIFKDEDEKVDSDK